MLFLHIISFVNITLTLLGKTREPFYLLVLGARADFILYYHNTILNSVSGKPNSLLEGLEPSCRNLGIGFVPTRVDSCTAEHISLLQSYHLRFMSFMAWLYKIHFMTEVHWAVLALLSQNQDQQWFSAGAFRELRTAGTSCDSNQASALSKETQSKLQGFHPASLNSLQTRTE